MSDAAGLHAWWWPVAVVLVIGVSLVTLRWVVTRLRKRCALRNAKHACQDSERADKRLTVGVANGHGRIKIRVTDNGVGIPAENLTRIFNYGFTTRETGHGFGLHCSALAAREISGSLQVQSDGPGHGATFTLELPRPIQEHENSNQPAHKNRPVPLSASCGAARKTNRP